MSGFEIIGLSGKAGSGKDHIGRTVLRSAGYNQWAFAWPMKMLAIGRGFTYNDVFVEKPPAVRDMLQQLGTEEGWMIHGKNYWVNQAEGYLNTLRDNLGLEKFYFTDVRFVHEAEWIKGMGGKLVRVVGRSSLTGDVAAHSSETALDDYTGWDAIVNNEEGTTRDELSAAMDCVLPRKFEGGFDNWVQAVIPLTRGGPDGGLGRWA